MSMLLGEGERPIEGSPAGFGYPYRIEFLSGQREKPFSVEEGRGCVYWSSQYSAADLLHEGALEALHYTNLEWIRPLLKRIADGEFPSPEALEEAVAQAFFEHWGWHPVRY